MYGRQFRCGLVAQRAGERPGRMLICLSKINAYIKSHPKAGGEAVAVILLRYRDAGAPASPR